MLVLVIALAVVNAWMMGFANVILDGLVNSVTFLCVRITAPPMGCATKLPQHVIAHLVIQVGDDASVAV